ncbi:MAG: hypothetical protein AAGA65_28940 [Actinomycetota bacterium]
MKVVSVLSAVTLLCLPTSGLAAGSVSPERFVSFVLEASDDGPGDYLGEALAFEGNTVIVGAKRTGGGAAYVFERTRDGWIETAKLTAADGGNWFGFFAALEDDTAMVGSSLTNSVHVFERTPASTPPWKEVAKLTPPPVGTSQSGFGIGLDFEGDTAVVGARAAFNGLGARTGLTFVFDRDLGGPGAWGQAARLLPEDGEGGDRFGQAVVIEGTTIAVGAPSHDAMGLNSGAVYIFERDPSQPEGWGQTVKLVPEEASPFALFGEALAFHGDVLVVGAVTSDVDSLANAGQVYVFERRSESSWEAVQKISAADITEDGMFGAGVAFDGNRLLIGATGTERGYLYERSTDTGDWFEVAQLVPGHAPNSSFPVADGVSLWGDTLLVGVPDADEGNGFVAGFDLPLFADGFERGDLTAWSGILP